MILKLNDRRRWLENRRQGLGGSDAGAAIGMNKYRSNVDVWREKAGITAAKDISDKPAVNYGKAAEPLLRELFKLDFPQYHVEYHEFWMYFNDEYPFMYATLDGELTDENGRKGVLEIKTTTIQNSNQWSEWDGRVPDTYYTQLLHQLAATGWDFAILKAHIRYCHGEELRATDRHYTVERSDVADEIEYLIQQEKKFWESVSSGKEPPLILPQI